MKKTVLLFTISLASFSVRAQSIVAISNLVVSGTRLVRQARSMPTPHAKALPSTVTHFKAGAKSIPQKRTPVNQIKGKAAGDIQTLEEFLTACQRAYSDSTQQVICQNSALPRSIIDNIHKLQPTWNVLPYKQELAFYEQEQQRRQQPSEVVGQ